MLQTPYIPVFWGVYNCHTTEGFLEKGGEQLLNVGCMWPKDQERSVEDTIETQLTFALFSSGVLGLNLSTY